MMKDLKPLFRWAGAKTKMKSKYGSDFWPGSKFDRFVDPFFGTGAVCMWIFDRYPNTEFFVNDYNEDIINIYKQIKTNKKEFLEVVDQYQSLYISKNKEDRKTFYYEQRNIHAYNHLSDAERAGLLFSLLKTSFNGIWQINKNTNNKFGTPCGLLNEREKIYDVDVINAFHIFSQNLNLHSNDFETLDKYVNQDTYVFLDPPYRDCFTKYTKNAFDDYDQERLCNMMNNAANAGAFVAMANKYHYDNFFESKLIDSFSPLLFDVTYTAGRGAKDGQKVKVTECLIKNF